MHLLSSHNRSEFLACPQLVRFEYAKGDEKFEPTFLIKGSTLLLKYIVLGVPMQLAFAMHGDRLLYALRVCDDGDSGGILWSVMERTEELNGIRGLARGEPLVAFLFNELAVNVAWKSLPTPGALDRLSMWADSAELGQVDHAMMKSTIEPLIDRLHQSDLSNGEWLLLEIGGESGWNALDNHFITADAASSLIDLFDENEGNQQEQLGIWLTDNLHPLGIHYSPQIPKGSGTRELTDILFSHEFGAVLIESKTLSVLARERLPDRAKLKRDISAHIGKAFAQLRGAIRALKSGVPATSPKGDTLTIEREKPAHAIVLIPDLELVADHPAYGIEFIRDFMGATGAIPHLLDISELLRVVQAAEIIAKRGTTTTPMMAFDYYLMERANMALAAGTLCIEVLLRLTDDEGAPE
ncbi:hypothetical protein A7X68_10545 [Stenotrophomonas maltophilia]|nr:hypothetical protein A7X68_10545 [Stenotrophomonas maltophilia]PZS72602.1 hypothetical protein A7X75_07940 [Stenotrophomonas maltophilia]HEP1207164.1 hypothetical protein [Stenotrophomonas maltophilia]